MSHTAVHTYSFDTIFDAAQTKSRAGEVAVGGTVLSGPSPFEVPERVWISSSPPDRFVVNFDYADQEAPEDRFRALTQDLAVNVGARTKRIVALRLATEDLLSQALGNTDLKRIQAVLGPELHTRQAKNALEKNVDVVAIILKQLQSEISKAVAAAQRVEGAGKPIEGAADAPQALR